MDVGVRLMGEVTDEFMKHMISKTKYTLCNFKRDLKRLKSQGPKKSSGNM